MSLEPVDRARHGALVTGWLTLAHVARWWGDPEWRSEEFEQTPPDDHVLIALDGRPVGYARWQPVGREELDAVGLTTIPDGSIDLDLFLADPDQTGQGIGPEAVRLLIERLRQTTEAPLCGLCTSIDNAPAQKAFAKAGLTRNRRYDDPRFGPLWVFTADLRDESD